MNSRKQYIGWNVQTLGTPSAHMLWGATGGRECGGKTVSFYQSHYFFEGQ